MAVLNFALLGLPSHRPHESVLQLSDLADHQKDCPLKQIELKINSLREPIQNHAYGKRQTANGKRETQVDNVLSSLRSIY